MPYIVYFRDGSTATLDQAGMTAVATLMPGEIVSSRWVEPAPTPAPAPTPTPTTTTPTTVYLQVHISPAGSGSVQPSPSGMYISPGKVSYPAGTVVSLKALPAVALAYFDHWEGSVTGKANPITLTMNANKDVRAVFNVQYADTFKLTTGVSGNGTVAPSSGVFDKGSKIILTAKPASGYAFGSWSGDTGGTTPVPNMPASLQVTMDRDRHIVANFTAAPPVPPPPAPGVTLLASATRYVTLEIVEPPPVSKEVQLLARHVAEVDILKEMYVLARASQVITPEFVGVVLLDSAEQVVIAGDIGVIKLDTRDIEVDAVGVPVLPEEEKAKINWWLWGGLAVVAIVIVAAIVRGRG